MKYVITVNGQEFEVMLEGSSVRVGDVEAEASLTDVDGTPIAVVLVGGRIHRVLARRGATAGRYIIELRGFRFDVDALDERTRAIRLLTARAAGPVGPSPLVAPMPGLVVRVLVRSGDQVAAGQGLVVMEAMKMENELRAAGPGTVKGVHVAPGDAVEKGAVLVELS